LSEEVEEDKSSPTLLCERRGQIAKKEIPLFPLNSLGRRAGEDLRITFLNNTQDEAARLLRRLITSRSMPRERS
jgi:hypothetical protein